MIQNFPRAFLTAFVLATLIWVQRGSAQAQVNTSVTNPSSTSSGSSSNWGASFFSIGSLSQGQLETGGSSYGAYSYLGLNYKISKSRRFSIRPVFTANSAGLDRGGKKVEGNFAWGDAHLAYSDSEIASLGPAGVSTTFKIYLPTSESSKQMRTVLIFRPETFVAYDVAKDTALTWVIKPDFYLQSQTTFADPGSSRRADGSFERKTTPLAVLEHYWSFAGT